jgi:APA family basic amino acid/polyamine antiporter
LRRVLGLFDVTMLVMGSIIGAGVFNTPASIAAAMGSTGGVIAVWCFGGVIALSGALVFAELGAMMPLTGGQYVFVRAGAGRCAAFLFGWIALTALISSAIAYVAGVFTDHLEILCVEWAGTRAFEPGAERAIAAALIAGLALVNARGIRLGANIHNVAMLAKVAGIVLVIALGALVALGLIEPARGAVASASPAEWSWAGVGAAMFGIVFTYGGWQNVTAVASEIRDAERTLPLGTLIGTACVVLLYIALNLALIAILGVAGVAASATPVATAAGAAWPGGSSMVALLVMLSTFAITHVLLMLPPRIYLTMARDGVFFAAIGRIHSRFATPHVAIALQAGCAIAYVFLSSRLVELVQVCSMCDWVFFTICGATLFILRVRQPDAPRPYRAWGYPIVPAIFVLSSAAVLVRMALSASAWPALQAGGLFAIGIGAYALWSRRSPAARDR